MYVCVCASAKGLAASTGCQQDNQHYTVLLIINDGSFNDKDATIAAIINASSYPLSIISIGVGSSDFSAMEELDSPPGQMLRAPGIGTAVRNIFQFIPYSSCRTPQELSAKLLAEVRFL